jgi:transcriptional regulator with XRE-family HTH domain
MDLNRLFISNMKKWRKNRGISQKMLAEQCAASHTYIRQIESGVRTPSFAFIGKLAESLEIEAYQLFYDETAARSKNPYPKEHLETIKTGILAQAAHGIDMLIIEAQNPPPPPILCETRRKRRVRFGKLIQTGATSFGWFGTSECPLFTAHS